MSRIIWIAVAMLSHGVATAAGAGAAASVEHALRTGTHLKTARLATLTARDLGHASKPQNIDALLGLADVERRTGPDPILRARLWERYNAIPAGDRLLLACLQSPACDPDRCIGIARLSGLHREVMIRRPNLNRTQANQAVGEITERLMQRYFEASGWQRLEGQVGRSGIDGLFVKQNPDGSVREVLFVESKYNTGSLQPTNHGMQMSREWLLRKLGDLAAKSPDERAYAEIEALIERGWYRSRVWNMSVDDSTIRIGLQKVQSKNGDVELSADDGLRIPAPPQSIRIDHPDNAFEEELVRQLRAELARVGREMVPAAKQ